MAGHNNHVGSGSADFRNYQFGLLDDSVEIKAAVNVVAVPECTPWRHQSDQAHSHPAVPGVDAFEDVRRERAPPGGDLADVCAQQREVQLTLPGAEQRYAVIELVITEGDGVIAHLIHGKRHGMLDCSGSGCDLGKVVGQRRSLNGVAGVQGDAVSRSTLGPHRLDESGGLGNADSVARGVGVGHVLEVVPIEHIVVQVSGAQHRQGEALPAWLLSRLSLGCRCSCQ
jgi:hypothetical protein